VNPGLSDTLREWRMGMARKSRLPAFRIFTNKVLDNLASDLPTSYDELHMVNGVGPYFVKRYRKEIIRVIKTYLKQKI
jgi:DNA topoisomerase-3